MFHIIKSSTFDYDGYYLLALTNVTDKTAKSRILSDLRGIHISNAFVLGYWENLKMAPLYTNFQFQNTRSCQWASGSINVFIHSENAFRNELSLDNSANMTHCVVNVSINQYAPYTIAEEHPNDTRTVHGIEIEILRELSTALNIKMNFVLSNEDSLETVFEKVQTNPIGKYTRIFHEF